MTKRMITDKNKMEACKPPHCLESEKQVLGAMILDSICIDLVLKIVKRRHFYIAQHQILFHVLWEMHTNGMKIDPAEFCKTLESRGLIDEIGGAVYVTELIQTVKLPCTPDAYAAIVRDKATLRKIIMALCKT